VRAFVSHLGGAEFIATNGDDALEETVPGGLENFQRCGHIAKLWRTFDRECDSFEFCSTEFPSRIPKNVDKMLVNFFSRTDIVIDRFMALSHELRHHPQRGNILRFAARIVGLEPERFVPPHLL